MAETGPSHGSGSSSNRAHVAIDLIDRYGVVAGYDEANLQPAEPGKGITGNVMRKKACVKRTGGRNDKREDSVKALGSPIPAPIVYDSSLQPVRVRPATT